MRKFLFFSTIIFIIVLSILSGTFNKDEKEEIKTLFKVQEKNIAVKVKDNWRKFYVSGVNLDPGKPSAYPGDNYTSKEEYKRWLNYIYDMNVNLIRVQNVMPVEFYDALRDFNTGKEKPLYLLQGIWFDEVLLKDGYDVQSKKLNRKFEKCIKYVVDAVHGTPYKNIGIDLFTKYDIDVSEYVIGYTVGIEWPSSSIIYSEIMNYDIPYKGKYFYTDSNASSFEDYLAKVCDYLVDYETKNYNEQKLITLIGSSPYEIVIGKIRVEENSNDNSNIKKKIDIENIKTTSNLKSGLFASYKVYPSFNSMVEFERNHEIYLEKLNGHHTIPVVIAEFGVPSSRFVGDFYNLSSDGHISEQKQGEILSKAYDDIKSGGFAGSVLFEWQDSYYRSAWNTKKLKILDKSASWNDAQTYSQHFGLMAFDPGKEKSVCYPDDSIKEWTEKDLINSNNKIELYSKNDEKYMYFMVRTKDGSSIKDKKMYIDLDITPNSGSRTYEKEGLKFESPVDFIIKIDGKDSRILVQEYYNTHLFLSKGKDLKTRPEVIPVKKYEDKFSKILFYVRKKTYIEREKRFEHDLAIESGKLLLGNTNPKSNDFNSSADFYIGNKYVEIRIPWSILNFMDPSTKQIQDDYYKSFDFEPITIDTIGMGITVKDELVSNLRLKSRRYNWSGWEIPTYHERLKKSYYILKDKFEN